ncbi:MAG: alanine/glycine:cation symporter family protein [Cardiobacteriaceae bacterium]|nr:alanine/glycine:cation symporter family protein [Cardiobacteriaceae bacterium]
MEKLVSELNGIIWSPALIWLCLGVGLLFSIKTRFAQVRHFKEMCRLLIQRNDSAEGVSSFQALTMALSGRVGAGNIAGVAAAIGFGGPGAIFWMWMMAFLGASTAYAESTLAQIYKVQDHGQYRGGPAYYLDRYFNKPWFGVVFAIAMLLACAIFLPGVQSNASTGSITKVFGDGEIIATSFGDIGINRLIGLACILILLGMIIFGGVKRIAKFTEVIVPFMALGYIIIALLVVFVNIDKLPAVISLIFNDAFTAQAGLGAAIGWGVKRGVYSNEAGQGTGPHHAAAAEVDHPAQQGLVQAFSVYIDTLFVCSATAFMILITNSYNVVDGNGVFLVQNLATDTNINGPQFTQIATSSVFGKFGPIFTSIALFFFTFTTILAYYYISETNVAYLLRNNRKHYDVGMFWVRVVVMFSVAYGAVNSSGYIWEIGDIGVGLTAWLNIVGIVIILFSSQPTIKAMRDYEEQVKAGAKRFTFDPQKLGIKGATFWEERLKKENRS